LQRLKVNINLILSIAILITLNWVLSSHKEKAAAETPAVVYDHQLNPNYVYGPYEGYSSYTVVRDEDPNGCTIC
jgi:hypothetical protein